MRVVLAILMLVLTMMLAGLPARAPQPGVRSRIVHRFIDESPAEIFDSASFVQRSTTFTWNFDDTDEWSRWTRLRTVGSENGNDDERGREAGALAADTWVRPVVLDTETIDGFELAVSRPPRGIRFVLSWAAQGEFFTPERSVEGVLQTPVRGARGRVWFELRDQPSWYGAINRLRLRIRSPAHAEPPERLLRELSGMVVTPASRESLTVAADRFWKIDLGGDVRNTFLTPAGTWRAFSLEVPHHAALRLAFGPRDALAQPVTVRVEAFSEGRTTTLFSGQVDPGTPAWQRAWIDLGPLGGRRARIRFRALIPSEHNANEQGANEPSTNEQGATTLERATVAWAHPEILQSIATDSPSPSTNLPPPHVVLVSIDTLRADHLSLYGYERSTSPHLDAWAARHASVFLRTVAQAPWTLPSHVSMLSGINAHRHGVNHDGAIPESVPLLAEHLRRAGYTTIAVTGGGFMHPRHGFARGFDRYVYWQGAQRADTQGDRDSQSGELASGIATAMEILAQNQGEPLFLFLHTYETHSPYVPREPFFSSFGPTGAPGATASSMRLAGVPTTPDDGFVARSALLVQGADAQRVDSATISTDPADDPEGRVVPDAPPLAERIDHLRALYDSGIAYMDALLEPLLARIERTAERVPFMVVFTSDHGEALGETEGEKRRFGHVDLFDDTLLVPLVIRTPSGFGAGRRIDQQVRSIDIVPTVLELAGLPPATGIDGHALTDLLHGMRASPDAGFGQAWSYASNPNQGLALRHENRLKYVLNSTAWARIGDRERYFDLRRDAGEQEDLASEIDTDALRARALEALGEAPGLRVRITRPSDTTEPLVGELRGPTVHPLRVENLGEPCACVTWSRDEHARFSVAPGQQLDLLIEEVESSTLTLSLPARWGHQVEISVPLDGLENSHTRRRTLSRRPRESWRWQDDSLAPDALGWIEVWWHGEQSLSAPGATAGGELDRALRALGYL